ncbi:uncharacterized protein LOC132936277 isoform X2 [Metopolophium dirhodum]|uniref:uncharacterized protein LOC132936277 isoform X2 n=1 Tax=Metopolophium dirhodum TaxID=44670 RepID=UPI00298F7783|nr:uncharacterized protein LOC132936277 isoform X2 [Metopolophium dirhodum]
MTLLFHSKKKYTNVISWVNHELYQRKDCLPELMEHVKIIYFMHYNFIYKNQFIILAFQCIWIQLGVNLDSLVIHKKLHYQLQNGITQQPNYERNAPGINDCRQTPGLGVIRDQFVFVAGGVNKSSLKSKMYAMMESILKEFIDQVMDLIFLIWSYADFVLE